MKKINTTYLDNLVSKILKETLEERADTLVSKIKGNMCEQCGGNMNEDVCEQCGNNRGEMEEGIYDVDNTLDDEFDYVQEDMVMGNSDDEELDSKNDDACKYHMDNFGPDNERTIKFCGSDINESLKGSQKRRFKKSETDEGNAFTGALSKARKSGDDNFEVGGKKFETKEGKKIETDEGNAFSGALAKAKKSGEDSFEVDGKKYQVKESYKLTESELVSMIEKIVKEQKTETVEKTKETKLKPIGGTPKGYSAYEKAHKGSGKENDDYIKDVTKKMKDYLKDGSKGDYDMNPKMFPKGNGEIEKMKKKAYIPSKSVEEYADNLTAAGLENLDYDEIQPNDEWVNDNIVGSSRTGNNPKWANTGESDVNKKRKEIKDKNLLAKIKRKAYNKSPQPIISDKSGEDESDKLMTKLESTTDKKQKQISEEFNRMKSLIAYDRKTQ
jgi:hypothetical protein